MFQISGNFSGLEDCRGGRGLQIREEDVHENDT